MSDVQQNCSGAGATRASELDAPPDSEGPSSPIDAILASDAARAQAAAHGVTNGNGQTRFATAGANGESSKGTLADRIRALQSRASRIAQPSGA